MKKEDKVNLFESAVHQHINDKFQIAHDLYVKLLNIDPQNVEANYLLGILYLQNGLISEGKDKIRLFEELSSSEGAVHQPVSASISDYRAKYDNEKLNDFAKSAHTVGPFPTETIDAWRHFRMVEFINCFDKNTEWLTVGDFYGKDSWMLLRMGFEKVTASNLYIDGLQKSAQVNNIPKFKEINAEAIDMKDNSVDYILCKEALHHMPRPYMAIYEMLRVAAKGVIFIEPQDPIIDWGISNQKIAYRELIQDSLVGTKISYKSCFDNSEILQSSIDWWESDARNYVYTISKRECKKIALGLGLPSFGYKCFNDYYNSDLNGDPSIRGAPSFDKTLEQIKLHDTLCENIGKPYSYISGLFFKESPPAEIAEKLTEYGFEFLYTPSRYLPVNWPNIKNLF